MVPKAHFKLRGGGTSMLYVTLNTCYQINNVFGSTIYFLFDFVSKACGRTLKVNGFSGKILAMSHLLPQVKEPKLVVRMGGVWALSLEGAISSFRYRF